MQKILGGAPPSRKSRLPDFSTGYAALKRQLDGLGRDGPEGVTLAVSLEPEGGAPGDLPTGPVLATDVLPILN